MLIGYFSLSISGQTHELIIYAMHQPVRVNNLNIFYGKETNLCQFFMPLLN